VPQVRRRGTPLRAVFRSVAINNAPRPRLFPQKVPRSTSVVVVIVFGLETPTTVDVGRRYVDVRGTEVITASIAALQPVATPATLRL
jgi:hypothetical protein